MKEMYTIRNPKTGETITREFTAAQLCEAARDGYTITRKPAAPQIIETRTMDAATLRNVCIINSWYTRGTCAQYNRLFDRLRNERGDLANLTTAKLYEIAEDIRQHSDLPDDYDTPCIMFELARRCTVCFSVAE